MSGMRPEERLKKGGLEIKKGSVVKAWIGSIIFAPRGHVLFHPRADEMADPALVDSIFTEGFRDNEPILVFEETLPGGGKALYPIDGSRRTNAAKAAEPKMVEAGKLKAADPRLFVPIEIFTGTIEAALAARIQADSNPLKKPHTPSVLAATFRPLAKFGWGSGDIASVHGKLSANMVSLLLRFETLPTATREAFDDGRLPLEALATFLDDITPADHEAAIKAAVEAGGTVKPRAARKAARKAAGVKSVPRPSAIYVTSVYEALLSHEVHPEVKAIVAWAAGEENALDDFPVLAQIVEASKPKPGRKAGEETAEE